MGVTRTGAIGWCLALAATAPAAAGWATGTAVEAVRLSALGVEDDGDGYADTNETLRLSPVLVNLSGSDLTSVRLVLQTDSPHVACMPRRHAEIASFPAGTPIELDQAFVVTLGDVDRAALALGPHDPLSLTFSITPG